MVAEPACKRDGTDVLEVTDLTRTIARALACDPILLLMDEPFGSVDAQTREDLEDLTLRVRAESGITILVVTHDIDESVYVGTGHRATPGPGRILADLVNLPQPGTRPRAGKCPSSSSCGPRSSRWCAATPRPPRCRPRRSGRCPGPPWLHGGGCRAEPPG